MEPIQNEDYREEMEGYWPTIMFAWRKHCDLHPVIVCDLVEKTVGAYPAKEYIDGLSERTRAATFKRYEECDREGGMTVFVYDRHRRKLQSYCFTAQEIDQ